MISPLRLSLGGRPTPRAPRQARNAPVRHVPLHVAAWVIGGVGTAIGFTGCAASQSDAPDLADVVADANARQIRARELFAQAEQARAAGDIDQAVQLYQQSVTLDPDAPEPWNNLGVLLMDQRRYMDAAEAFRNALTYSRPEDPRAAENLGLVYARAGWGEESLLYYLEALKRAPTSTTALRGAIRAGHLLNVADDDALQRVRTGLLVEPDPQWHEFFQRERFRIEQRLRAEAEG